MYCALSGNIPKEPVVSVKSGHLFERALIEKELAVNGNKCPETGEPLFPSDLLPLRSGQFITPLPPEKSSMPHVLDHVRAEWDRLTLELHTAQKQLHQTRQELATALYRCDASARVIAKLEKQRDEFKADRETSTANGDAKQADERTDGAQATEVRSKKQIDEKEKEKESSTKDELASEQQIANDQKETKVVTLPEGIVSQAQKLAKELQETRKSRKSSAPKSSVLSSFAEMEQTAVDGADVELRTVCVNGGKTIVGCSNGKLHVVEQDMKVSHSAEAHHTGISAMCWDEKIFTGGKDGVVKVWDEEVKCKAIFDGKGSIQEVERHPLKSVMYCGRADGFEWRNVEDGVVIGSAKVENECGAIHPDGLLLATGGRKGMQMWDFSSLERVAVLPANDVKQVAMSEKGYYMVSVGADGAHVWDLRKQAVVGSVDMHSACGVGLDEFGEYGCVAGGDEVHVFTVKKRAKSLTRIAAKAQSTERLGVAWGPQCSFVLVGGSDGVLRKFGEVAS
eukprot:TRINITY_DN56153_c0_g1_i1.p1 TRINITY_DN56153_c0_g1~~TRINITY_DN56153_c0_g1_i1.p1  ORF type:complete len:509 (+),score=95.93 TRINITY_DN56153_c0_g1_i1:356-1882(+)